MAQCPVCGKEVDEAAVRAASGHTAFGATEVDPAKGTRQFHDGRWHYFDSLECRNRFMMRSGEQGKK
jgi:YHS domain-containing protein